jgi:hypothetical protein
MKCKICRFQLQDEEACDGCNSNPDSFEAIVKVKPIAVKKEEKKIKEK